MGTSESQPQKWHFFVEGMTILGESKGRPVGYDLLQMLVTIRDWSVSRSFKEVERFLYHSERQAARPTLYVARTVCGRSRKRPYDRPEFATSLSCQATDVGCRIERACIWDQSLVYDASASGFNPATYLARRTATTGFDQLSSGIPTLTHHPAFAPQVLLCLPCPSTDSFVDTTAMTGGDCGCAPSRYQGAGASQPLFAFSRSMEPTGF
ncbi:hypothetical protein EJ06DRAFT_376468 [Trichodelitschia bisporula]|uniref:Uncharacterized protein n=1 Tax=Trichodelitschia bisporula TaxID=703511 RepID=A0A6G1HZ53_9PEZI|nr:hypothetical protein EJ06DRAFT_376468 [Trichodelitschia bisporula]